MIIIKSILFVIHFVNLKYSDEIINKNLARNRLTTQQVQQLQTVVGSYDTVSNWKMEDPRLTQDMRQQFLMKTKTRRTPTLSDRVSPRERVPLATTDFNVSIHTNNHSSTDSSICLNKVTNYEPQ